MGRHPKSAARKHKGKGRAAKAHLRVTQLILATFLLPLTRTTP
jgi:hypothetical protein